MREVEWGEQNLQLRVRERNHQMSKNMYNNRPKIIS